jgi:hypothetical protein
MSVIPFPEPDQPDPFTGLFGIFPSILEPLVDVIPDDLTLEDAWDQLKDMPVKPLLRDLLGAILDNGKGDTA